MKHYIYLSIFLLHVYSCQKQDHVVEPTEYTLQEICLEGEYGVGVLFQEQNVQQDVYIFDQPQDSADTLAIWFRQANSTSSYMDVVSGDDVVKQSLIEYAYEVSGLPLISNDISSWVNVIYGYGSNGALLTGWVRFSDNLRVHKWSEYLQDRAQFVATCKTPVFYESPGGEALTIGLSYLYNDHTLEKRLDYLITPITVEGRWMKVKLSSPSVYCTDAIEKLSMIVWIPYLNEDGSPAVWFYTRGC